MDDSQGERRGGVDARCAISDSRLQNADFRLADGLGLPGLVDTELVDVHHTVGGLLWSRNDGGIRGSSSWKPVRLALESERPLAEVARELGLAPNVLHRWKQQLETRDPATAFPGHGKRAGPEDEVWQLRRELEQVKQERDFLKKAAAFFARESP